jgi:hypothetical protein
MNNRRVPLEKEEPKHKKKSKAKGLSRSKHKHEYIPVLLHRPFLNPFKQKNEDIISVNKVCKICGRIDECLRGEEWYDTEYKDMGEYRIGKDILNKKALALPKWYTHDYFDKFAYKGE